jgi:hypothetical protein
MGNTNNHKNDEKNISRGCHHLVAGGLLCPGCESVGVKEVIGYRTRNESAVILHKSHKYSIYARYLNDITYYIP